jgi:hypothetical protein
MVSAAERLMSRRQVQAMIKADPVTIIPIRTTKVDDGAGGWLPSTPTPVKPITGTIVPAKRRLSNMLTNTELGDVLRAPYIFLGPHNADLLKGDIFAWDGNDFEVQELELKEEIGITAQIDYVKGPQNERLSDAV